MACRRLPILRWAVGCEPGTQWHYSGDGYVVVQQLMTDVSGQSFPHFMHAAVFEKLDMHDSTYEEPLPAGRAASAASGTLMDGTAVDGRWQVNAEMAAGGLWSTPTDLAKLAIELALSIHGMANHLFTKDLPLFCFVQHSSQCSQSAVGISRRARKLQLLGAIASNLVDQHRNRCRVQQPPAIAIKLLGFLSNLPSSIQVSNRSANSERTLGLLGSGSVPSITEANFKLAALAALADFVS